MVKVCSVTTANILSQKQIAGPGNTTELQDNDYYTVQILFLHRDAVLSPNALK